MNYRRIFIPDSLIFITIVTNNRNPILLNSINILKQSYKNVKKYYDFQIIAYSILPDHIHCIIKPRNANDYPKITKSFKYSMTKLINVGLVNPTYSIKETSERKNKPSKKLWQNRYWEHTIRNEEDLYRHIDYIHYNSVKHYNIAPKNWEYSSFKRFVKKGYYELNWCNFGDKNNILNMNYE